MPHSVFSTPELGAAEFEVIERIEKLKTQIQASVGSFGKPRKWLGSLRSLTQAKAIRGSNSIEGYRVSIEDAIAAVEGEEILDANAETKAAIEGYQTAMTYVLRLADDPHFAFGVHLVKSLHFMMLRYKGDKNPGLWRPGAIHVEETETGKVVYQGPDVELVPQLMEALVESLQDAKTPAIINAAMAHLNLAMIHPFSDGNGRMARCLQTLVLARSGTVYPLFSSIEEYLGVRWREYYDVLAAVGNGSWQPERDARPWIRFCLTAHFRQATTMVRRIEEINNLWIYLEELSKELGFPERCSFALSDAAMGYRIRNSTYRVRAEISNQTASRDFTNLVELGLLVAEGEKRGRSYMGSAALREHFNKIRNARKKEIPDPFDELSGATPAAKPGQSLLFPAS